MDVKFAWIPIWHHMEHVSWLFGLFQKPPLGGRSNRKPGDHGILNAHNHWFILFYHMWGPAWIEIRWNNTWLRSRSRMTSHYTWEYVTTLHDFGGALEQPLDAFFWALTISRSRLLARVWSDPKITWFFGHWSFLWSLDLTPYLCSFVSMFTTHHICIVLRHNIRYISRQKCPKFMHKFKYT